MLFWEPFWTTVESIKLAASETTVMFVFCGWRIYLMFCIFFIFSLCFFYVCLMFHKVKDEREKILRLSVDDQASDGGQGVVEQTSNKQED